jgi:hypothetical protein
MDVTSNLSLIRGCYELFRRYFDTVRTFIRSLQRSNAIHVANVIILDLKQNTGRVQTQIYHIL